MKQLFDQWKISVGSLDKGSIQGDACVIPIWKG